VEARDASLRAVLGRPIRAGALRFGLDLTSRFDLRATDRKTDLAGPGGPVVVREQTTVEDARRIDLGLFGELERTLGPGAWTLAAGLRADRVSSSNEGGFFGESSTSEGSFSGYAALRRRLAKGWEISAQVARGFRDARLSDRYFRGVTGRGVVTGDPDLEPESSDHLDLALRGEAGPLRLAVYGYAYRIRDLIDRFELPDESGEFFFLNGGEQEVRGLEIEADLPFSPGISARATLGRARGWLVDLARPAADIPATTLTLSLQHRPSERFWWRVDGLLVARDDRGGPTEAPVVPGYGLLGAAAGWRFSDRIETRLLLENLLDKAYPASADASAPLAPGRSASLVLSGRF
jgi:outer membrane receptor protein involved in Fe transport